MNADAVVLVLVAATAATALTAWARSYALQRKIVDRPNHRSAHDQPTPRGGGIGIVLTVVPLAVIAALAGMISGRTVIALAGGLAVAWIGWLDDVRGATVRARLAVHLLAAAWAVAWTGGLPELRAGDTIIILGPAGAVLAVVAIVWAINLYNFMDGLDGFAGIQAVMSGTVGGILLLGSGSQLSFLAFLIAAGSAGFLVWNWPPARIFMGDVGSGFLGFALAVLALSSERGAAIPLTAWLIIFGAFLFDATVTLARRLLRGEVVFAAHFEHAYQRAFARSRSHARVTGGLAVVNLALAALASWSVLRPRDTLAAILSAIGVLTTVYLYAHRKRDRSVAVG